MPENLYFGTNEAPVEGDNVEHLADGDVGRVELTGIRDPSHDTRRLVRVKWRAGHVDYHTADELVKLRVG